jgi:NADH:ubiquinone oxidoreductase subunit K
MYFKYFNKKILVLLSLEILMVALICLNLVYSFSSRSQSSFFSRIIFLTFMVIDRVFGLSILIFSSRNSTLFRRFLFKI